MRLQHDCSSCSGNSKKKKKQRKKENLTCCRRAPTNVDKTFVFIADEQGSNLNNPTAAERAPRQIRIELTGELEDSNEHSSDCCGVRSSKWRVEALRRRKGTARHWRIPSSPSTRHLRRFLGNVRQCARCISQDAICKRKILVIIILGIRCIHGHRYYLFVVAVVKADCAVYVCVCVCVHLHWGKQTFDVYVWKQEERRIFWSE